MHAHIPKQWKAVAAAAAAGAASVQAHSGDEQEAAAAAAVSKTARAQEWIQLTELRCQCARCVHWHQQVPTHMVAYVACV